MKNPILASIVLSLAMSVGYLVGCHKPNKVTPEQLPVSLEPAVYGAPANRPEIADVWPVWSVQVAWRATNSPDTYGPVTHLIQLKNKPTLADVQKFIPAPDYLPGKYKPLKVFNIVQIGPEKPVEIPEKK